MNGHKQIQTIHRISEVLAEAFSKVKFITDDYLSAYEQEKKHLKEKAKEHEKTHSSKDHNQAPEKPRKNSTVNDKPIVVEKPAESKKEQKKQKEAKKGNNPDKPKKPLTAFFRFQMEKLNTVKEEYPNLSHTEAVSVTSQLWGQMSPEERLPYQTACNSEMEGYHKNLNSFYATHPDDRPKNYNKQQKKNEKI